MDYEGFKEEWKQACRERHACTKGYEQFLRSNSIGEILQTAVDNWTDVYQSKFADFMAANIVRQFAGLEQEFHDAGFYVNEDSDKGICVVAHGNAKVYCRNAESEIELHDDAYGKIEAGRVWAYDWATVDSHQECWCEGHATVTIYGGELHDKGHRRIIFLRENEQ